MTQDQAIPSTSHTDSIATDGDHIGATTTVFQFINILKPYLPLKKPQTVADLIANSARRSDQELENLLVAFIELGVPHKAINA